MATKKWGKIGAPKSKKRKAWMRKLRASRKGIVLKKKLKRNKK